MPLKVTKSSYLAYIKSKCKSWCPCQIEGLALATGIDTEYDLIRESKHPLVIETDSKPVYEALQLVNKGKFSSNATMSSLLTNVNRTPIQTKHISGKARLNPIPDLQSRIPPTCTSEVCSVRKFLSQSMDAALEDGPKNIAIKEEDSSPGYANRNARKTAQSSNQACCEAKTLLT